MHTNAIIVSLGTQTSSTQSRVQSSTPIGFGEALTASVRKALDLKSSAVKSPIAGSASFLERATAVLVSVPVAPEEPIVSGTPSTNSMAFARGVHSDYPPPIDFGNLVSSLSPQSSAGSDAVVNPLIQSEHVFASPSASMGTTGSFAAPSFAPEPALANDSSQPPTIELPSAFISSLAEVPIAEPTTAPAPIQPESNPPPLSSAAPTLATTTFAWAAASTADTSIETDSRASSAADPTPLALPKWGQTPAPQSMPGTNQVAIHGSSERQRQFSSTGNEPDADGSSLANSAESPAGQGLAPEISHSSNTAHALSAMIPIEQAVSHCDATPVAFDDPNSKPDVISNDSSSSSIADCSGTRVASDNAAILPTTFASVAITTSSPSALKATTLSSAADHESTMVGMAARSNLSPTMAVAPSSLPDKKSDTLTQSSIPASSSLLEQIPSKTSIAALTSPDVRATNVSSVVNTSLIASPNLNQQTEVPTSTPTSQDASTSEMPQPHQVLDAAPPATAPPAPPMNIRPDVQTTVQMHLGIRTDAFGSVEIHTVVQQSQVGITIHADHDLSRWFGPEVSSLESGLNQHHFDLTAVDFNNGHSSAHTESGFQRGSGQGQGQKQEDLRESASQGLPRFGSDSSVESSDPNFSGQEDESLSSATSILANVLHAGFATNRVSIHV